MKYKRGTKVEILFHSSLSLNFITGFFRLGTVDVLGWIILCHGVVLCSVGQLAAPWAPPTLCQ